MGRGGGEAGRPPDNMVNSLTRVGLCGLVHLGGFCVPNSSRLMASNFVDVSNGSDKGPYLGWEMRKIKIPA